MVVVVVIVVRPQPVEEMRVPAGSSACWLCAMLDVLSALTLSATPNQPHPGDGGPWVRLARRGESGEGERRRAEDEGRGRYPRAPHPGPRPASKRSYALDHGLPPIRSREKDIRETEVLRFIDHLMNTRPDNCTRYHHRNIMLEYDFDEQHFQQPFQEQVKRAVQLANVLNSLFLYNRRSADLYKNVTYLALTHSLVQSDPVVKGCGIAFKLGQYRPIPPNTRAFFFPYSYRAANGAIIISDLTGFYEPFDTSWFLNQSRRDPARFSKAAETVFTNTSDVGSYSRYQSRWNKTARVSEKDGYWAKPYYDCLLEAWILQFSVPFFEMHSNGTAIFK